MSLHKLVLNVRWQIRFNCYVDIFKWWNSRPFLFGTTLSEVAPGSEGGVFWAAGQAFSGAGCLVKRRRQRYPRWRDPSWLGVEGRWEFDFGKIKHQKKSSKTKNGKNKNSKKNSQNKKQGRCMVRRTGSGICFWVCSWSLDSCFHARIADLNGGFVHSHYLAIVCVRGGGRYGFFVARWVNWSFPPELQLRCCFV